MYQVAYRAFSEKENGNNQTLWWSRVALMYVNISGSYKNAKIVWAVHNHSLSYEIIEEFLLTVLWVKKCVKYFRDTMDKTYINPF